MLVNVNFFLIVKILSQSANFNLFKKLKLNSEIRNRRTTTNKCFNLNFKQYKQIVNWFVAIERATTFQVLLNAKRLAQYLDRHTHTYTYIYSYDAYTFTVRPQQIK